MSTFLNVLADQKDRKELNDVLYQIQPEMDSLLKELNNYENSTIYNTQNIIDKIEKNQILFRYVNDQYPNWPDNAAGLAKRSWTISEPDTVFVKPYKNENLFDLDLRDNSIKTLIHELWHHAGPVKGFGSKSKGIEDYLDENMGLSHPTDDTHIGSQYHYDEAEAFIVDLLYEKGLWDNLRAILPNQEQNIFIRDYYSNNILNEIGYDKTKLESLSPLQYMSLPYPHKMYGAEEK